MGVTVRSGWCLAATARYAELTEVVSAPMANLLLPVKEAFAESELA